MPIFTWRVNLTIEATILRSGMEFFDLLYRVCIQKGARLFYFEEEYFVEISPSAFDEKALTVLSMLEMVLCLYKAIKNDKS